MLFLSGNQDNLSDDSGEVVLPVSLSIDKNPDTISYNPGDLIKLDGIRVGIQYSDGSSKLCTGWFSDYQFGSIAAVAGLNLVSIYYTEAGVELSINVIITGMTSYLITSSTSNYNVPYTGIYDLELHGGGGGSGTARGSNQLSCRSQGGGGSGQLYSNISLSGFYSVTVGAAGQGGEKPGNTSGTAGGTTRFGSYSIQGGTGSTLGLTGSSSTAGTSYGNLSTQPPSYSSSNNPPGGSGGASRGNYGDGANGAYSSGPRTVDGKDGQPGAVILILKQITSV